MAGLVAPARREPESRAKALIAVRAALEKQAERVVVIDLRELSTVTDFFVVCTAGSFRQIDAILDHIEASLIQQGCGVAHIEGSAGFSTPSGSSVQSPQWVLMDCGDVVVHLFDEPARVFYRLEELWADAPRLQVDEHGSSRNPGPTSPGTTEASASPPQAW